MEKDESHQYKIAIIAPFPPLPGGMAQLAVQIANNLEKDGHRVFRINLGAGKAGFLWLPILYMRFILVSFQSDIVHVISASGFSLWAKDLVALICARMLGRKTVLNFVGGAALEKVPSWGWCKRLPFRLAHSVVVPTILFRDSLIQAGIEARFKVIPHVVEIETFLAEKSETKNPVLFGAKTLVPYSGFDHLIEIFCLVKKHFQDAEFWIAGDGPAKSDLESLVIKKGISGVHFFGFVPDDKFPSLMGQASIFVHGTRYESFGIVLVEAMAAGLPVVAYSVGGIPEVIIDNVTGYLIPFGNVDIFSEKLVDLLENQSRRTQMSQKARQFSQRFSWWNIGNLWYELYRDLMEHPISVVGIRKTSSDQIEAIDE